jgi:hypothetical protein
LRNLKTVNFPDERVVVQLPDYPVFQLPNFSVSLW